MVIKKVITIIIFGILLIGYFMFSEENKNNESNEISDYYLDLINSNIINSLSMLKTINERIFNIIIEFIPENEIIENYYYQINLNLINRNTGMKITINEIIIDENGILNFPDEVITNVEYLIYYHEIFFNKYNGWRGDPTGKCFSILFNENNEYIRRYFWR